MPMRADLFGGFFLTVKKNISLFCLRLAAKNLFAFTGKE